MKTLLLSLYFFFLLFCVAVHVGPLKFCEVFLSETSEDNARDPKMAAFRAQLRACMSELLSLAKEAVKINATIIGPEQLNFHQMLEQKLKQVSKRWGRRKGRQKEEN